MKHNLQTILAFAVLVSMPFTIVAQEIDEVLEGMLKNMNDKYEGIENYTRKSTTMGMTTFEYYENTSSFVLENGQRVYVMRNVPPDEIQQRHSGGNALSNASANDLRNAALQIADAGAQMEAGMMSEMQGVGLPGGMSGMLMNPPPGKPWLSPNPRDMTSMYATMLNAAADEKDRRANEDLVGDAQSHAQTMQDMMSRSRITGRRDFNGVSAVEIAADNLDYVQEANGERITCDSMEMLVDDEKYVPLLFKMNCVANDGNESRPMTIEREDRDYRAIPGCGNMYEPFSSVMRIGGAMTPEQQAQMAEANVQLAELEEQLAAMPPEQRKMMESMMGGQLEMIRGMGSSGTMEIETQITELRCNTGLPNPMEIANTSFGANFGSGITTGDAAPTGGIIIDSDADLLKMIQLDLVKLDYEPGNTDGVMDKPTSVAISRFQVSKGMEVTGLPSPQLAGILQAASAGTSDTSGSSNSELTAAYLAGDWCTERTQERTLYSFAADGSYRVGVVGLTITQMDGINYLPETHTHQDFLNEFQNVVSRSQDRFTAARKGGARETLLRGNCFK